jgi:hypothetical protein
MVGEGTVAEGIMRNAMTSFASPVWWSEIKFSSLCCFRVLSIALFRSYEKSSILAARGV